MRADGDEVEGNGAGAFDDEVAEGFSGFWIGFG
jgi:hypothetical protein